MKQGWVKLHRKIQDNPMWFSEPFTRGQAWMDMIMMANHKPSHLRIRGQRIDVGVGCLARAQHTFAERWQWSRGKVIRFFKELEADNQIVQQTGHQINVITICKYSSYQAVEIDDGTLVGTSNGTTDGTSNGTSNGTHTRSKEVKNVKEVIISRARANEIPETGKSWCNIFMDIFDYSKEEAQTAKTIPLFNNWAASKITIGEVGQAADIAIARLGELPPPAYLDGILRTMRKPQKGIIERTTAPTETHEERAKRMSDEWQVELEQMGYDDNSQEQIQ